MLLDRVDPFCMATSTLDHLSRLTSLQIVFFALIVLLNRIISLVMQEQPEESSQETCVSAPESLAPATAQTTTQPIYTGTANPDPPMNTMAIPSLVSEVYDDVYMSLDEFHERYDALRSRTAVPWKRLRSGSFELQKRLPSTSIPCHPFFKDKELMRRVFQAQSVHFRKTFGYIDENQGDNNGLTLSSANYKEAIRRLRMIDTAYSGLEESIGRAGGEGKR